MFLSNAVIAVLIVLVVACLVFYSIKKAKSGLKLMLLAISIILVGGIITIDTNSDLGGFEYLIVLSGLILAFLGLRKND